MIGLGIDTGGTCTDAVLYNTETDEVLSFAKTPTTKNNLEEGIEKAIDMLDSKILSKADFVSLSTTLATNACVENRGGKVKILFIGLDKNNVLQSYKNYGFESIDDFCFIDGIPEGGFYDFVPLDLDELERIIPSFADCEAIGIVQFFSSWNNGEFEKQAMAVLKQHYDVPIICAHELFADINAVRRAAGTYLNGRLIPVVTEFLASVKNVLKRKNINRPVYIVRSDGSYMKEEFAKLHPVETLLCGPAASTIGGAWLSNESEALVVDMGGTTTDIAAIRNSAPVTVDDGILINGWKTFVKGLYVDTFGLGGDSCVRFKEGKVYLENFRVVPISMAAMKRPELVEKLTEIYENKAPGSKPTYEGFIMLKEPKENTEYSPEEIELFSRLKKGPVLIEELLDLWSLYRIDKYVKRLEKEGTIIRFGLTPTDMMHIKGDYNDYCTEAAKAAVLCMSKCSGIESKDIPDLIYNVVKEKLYCNIVRVLLLKSGKSITDDLMEYIKDSYNNKSDWIKNLFKTNLTLVGVGGPIHIFLPDVAEKLGTKAVIPDNAKVANALGTLTGKISVTLTQEITYCCLNDFEGYKAFIDGKAELFEVYDDASAAVKEFITKKAMQKITERGAKGEITFTYKNEENYAQLNYGSFLMSGKVTVIAYGNFA